ncbi:BPI/LBP/Plunc family like protein [Aduncisulcus paluster]|uniref:BPI/LBP/Plunc family like protein n=1 Tax=Aduncisulcus paluster TaxID=2918883 RepID=A0ABQ5K513_9EUKA|nr:BPI/LBP/Plunc family like protein [Aduncisulcus paluster]
MDFHSDYGDLDPSGCFPYLTESITQEGFNVMAEGVKDLIITSVMSTDIPSFTIDDIDTPIGVVNLNFDNIAIETLQIDSLVTYFLTNELEVTVNNFQFQISLNFGYKLQTWPYSSDSGQLEITANDASFMAEAHITSKNDAPFVLLDDAEFSLGNFSIDLRGTSEMLSTIIQVATPFIQYSIETSMNAILADAINTICQSLFLPSTCVTIDDTTAVDLRQPTDGICQDNILDLPASGLYYGTDTEFFVPPTTPNPDDLPFIVTNDHDQRMFSPLVVASLFDTYRQRNMFDVTLVVDDVPSTFPFPVTLSSLLDIFDLPSDIQQLSPDSPISLSLSLPATPNCDMMAGAVRTLLEFDAVWHVLDSDSGDYVDAVTFTLDVTLATIPTPKMKDDNIQTIGLIWMFSVYDASVTVSNCSVMNTQLSSLFHSMLLDLTYSDALDEWGDYNMFPLTINTTFAYINPTIWYGDTYFAMLMTYSWMGSSEPENASEDYSFDRVWNDHKLTSDSICLP